MKTTTDYPEDLLDEILKLNENLIYDYKYAIENFDENWEYVKTTLTLNEGKCIELYYKNGLNLQEIGKEIGLTKERIRQIINKGIRRLSHPSRLKILVEGYKNIKEVKSLNENIQNELIRLRKEYAELLQIKTKEDISEEIKEVLTKPSSILIEELDLSSRIYNCLKRANLNTIEDIIKLSGFELRKIRNLGLKSTKEIINKIQERGFEMKADIDDGDLN